MDANSKMNKWIVAACSLVLAGCSQVHQISSSQKDDDAAFSRLANDYIAGYLAWRPQTGTSLGLHQYDGKVTDYARPSLDAELQRLKSFERRLSALNTAQLGEQAYYDFRIL